MKKLVSLLVSLALIGASALPAAAEAPDWAAESYSALVEKGVLSEDARTEGGISRGDFAGALADAILTAVPERVLEDVPTVDYPYFADAAYDPSLLLAASFGILEGRVAPDGSRYADAASPLTREACAKMVCSALDFFTGLGYGIEEPEDAAAYADSDAISAWAAPFTGRIAAYQIMVGDEDGNFGPANTLDWPSAVVILDRALALMDDAARRASPGLALQSGLDWSGALAFGASDYQVSKPKTGYAMGYYTLDNGDGTLTGVVVPPSEMRFDLEANRSETVYPDEFYVERYDASGAVAESRVLPMELPIFGGIYAGGEYIYVAFGQEDLGEEDLECFRIVQYDKDWNRIGAASVKSGRAYTGIPFRSTVARMAESGDGSTLVLHASRQRYANDNGERHQSNITIRIDTSDMSVKSVSGEFPDNHVSHSFGQFVQFDGSTLVTVDHGDAYPRSFVLQTSTGSKTDLLPIYGPTGENVTNAIGSGFEVSDDAYLFLGCSDPQDGGEGRPWNVFLTVTRKDGLSTELTWLTHSEESIDCARLVRIDGDTFVAMWGQADGVHYQVLDGMGGLVGDEGVLSGVPMPPTQPVVQGRDIRWIQAQQYTNGAKAVAFTLSIGE